MFFDQGNKKESLLTNEDKSPVVTFAKEDKQFNPQSVITALVYNIEIMTKIFENIQKRNYFDIKSPTKMSTLTKADLDEDLPPPWGGLTRPVRKSERVFAFRKRKHMAFTSISIMFIVILQNEGTKMPPE